MSTVALGSDFLDAYARIPRAQQRKVRDLAKRNQQEWLDVIQTARRHLDEKKPKLPYRAVVVDESQDFHNEEWKLIRGLVPAGATMFQHEGESAD